MLLIDCDTNVHQEEGTKKWWKGYFFSSKEYDYRASDFNAMSGLVLDILMIKTTYLEKRICKN